MTKKELKTVELNLKIDNWTPREGYRVRPSWMWKRLMECPKKVSCRKCLQPWKHEE